MQKDEWIWRKEEKRMKYSETYVTFLKRERLKSSSFYRGDKMRTREPAYYVVEEKDGEYSPKVLFGTYEEAEEFIRFLKGTYTIIREDELDDYMEF